MTIGKSLLLIVVFLLASVEIILSQNATVDDDAEETTSADETIIDETIESVGNFNQTTTETPSMTPNPTTTLIPITPQSTTTSLEEDNTATSELNTAELTTTAITETTESLRNDIQPATTPRNEATTRATTFFSTSETQTTSFTTVVAQSQTRPTEMPTTTDTQDVTLGQGVRRTTTAVPIDETTTVSSTLDFQTTRFTTPVIQNQTRPTEMPTTTDITTQDVTFGQGRTTMRATTDETTDFLPIDEVTTATGELEIDDSTTLILSTTLVPTTTPEPSTPVLTTTPEPTTTLNSTTTPHPSTTSESTTTPEPTIPVLTTTPEPTTTSEPTATPEPTTPVLTTTAEPTTTPEPTTPILTTTPEPPTPVLTTTPNTSTPVLTTTPEPSTTPEPTTPVPSTPVLTTTPDPSTPVLTTTPEPTTTPVPTTPVLTTTPEPITPEPTTPESSTPILTTTSEPTTPEPSTPEPTTTPEPSTPILTTTPVPTTPVLTTTPVPTIPVLTATPEPSTPEPSTPVLTTAVISTPEPTTPVLTTSPEPTTPDPTTTPEPTTPVLTTPPEPTTTPILTTTPESTTSVLTTKPAPTTPVLTTTPEPATPVLTTTPEPTTPDPTTTPNPTTTPEPSTPVLTTPVTSTQEPTTPLEPTTPDPVTTPEPTTPVLTTTPEPTTPVLTTTPNPITTPVPSTTAQSTTTASTTTIPPIVIISPTNITEENVEEVVEEFLQSVQSNFETAVVVDVVAVERVVDNIATLADTNVTLNSNVTDNLVSVIENLSTELSVSPEPVPSDSVNNTNSIPRNADEILFKVELTENNTQYVSPPSETLRVGAAQVNLEEEGGLNFSFAGGFVDAVDDPSSPTIEIPSSLPVSGTTRIAFTAFEDATLFATEETTSVRSSGELDLIKAAGRPQVINSIVIGASLEEEIENLTDPIVIRLTPHTASVDETALDNNTAIRGVISRPRCVFFDYNLANGSGDWSSEGCVTTVNEDGSITCECDHLTSFAILMDVDTITHDYILEYMSYTGTGFSILGLIITIVTYLGFRTLRVFKSKKILTHFCVALLGLYVTYTLGLAASMPSNQTQCIATGFFMQYFLSAVFIWMFVEVLDMYFLFVKVWSSIQNYVEKMALLGWGAPLILSVATLAAHLIYTSNAEEGEDFTRIYPDYSPLITVCWMTSYGLTYGILIPLGVILIVNCILFSSVVYNVTCKRAQKGTDALRNSGRHIKGREHIINALAILLLSGPTWIFGFLINIDPVADGSARRVLSYVFVIFNSLQGLWIFIVFILRPKRVRKLWAGVLCSSIPGRTRTTSSGRNTATTKASTPSRTG